MVIESWRGPDVVRSQVDDAAAALNHLVDVLDGDNDLDVVLHRVCQQVVAAVPGADMAGLTEIRDGAPETVACTDDVVAEVDAVQYRMSTGPCLQAIEKQDVVRVNIEDAAQRWPEFSAAAARAGARSYLAAPLTVNGAYSGALNLYSRDGDGFVELDASMLELFTAAVEGALRSTHRYLQARALVEQLREALTSRAVIDQAKGVLMAVHGIDQERAFAKLVEQSQRENVKLRIVAERTVAAVQSSHSGESSAKPGMNPEKL